MEQEKKKKRVREGDHNQEQRDVSNSKRQAKKQNGLNSAILEDYKDDDHKTTSLEKESDLALGVFDFPWLKDGVVSKSEEWRFEDVFSSPLDETSSTTTSSTITTSAGFEFEFSGQCLCESPQALLDFPEEDKFEETESVDCIWSSLLNQPLQQPN